MKVLIRLIETLLKWVFGLHQHWSQPIITKISKSAQKRLASWWNLTMCQKDIQITIWPNLKIPISRKARVSASIRLLLIIHTLATGLQRHLSQRYSSIMGLPSLIADQQIWAEVHRICLKRFRVRIFQDPTEQLVHKLANCNITILLHRPISSYLQDLTRKVLTNSKEKLHLKSTKLLTFLHHSSLSTHHKILRNSKIYLISQIWLLIWTSSINSIILETVLLIVKLKDLKIHLTRILKLINPIVTRSNAKVLSRKAIRTIC